MEKRARAFARRRIATFAMQERTRSRSGGREPAVVWESLMPGQF